MLWWGRRLALAGRAAGRAMARAGCQASASSGTVLWPRAKDNLHSWPYENERAFLLGEGNAANGRLKLCGVWLACHAEGNEGDGAGNERVEEV